MIDVSKINFGKLSGLVPAIVVDKKNDQVLMLGFMNEEALRKTIEIGKATFYSRTRNIIWTKGETSGNYLLVKKIVADCDNDSLIVYVEPLGPVCHTGNYSCFPLANKNLNFLHILFELVSSRKEKLPEGSYTANLFNSGSDRIIQKVGEEAVEVMIAAKNRNRKDIIYECADLLFHLMIMLKDNDVELNEIVTELESRHSS
ncbi:MAG: bifunctional phosphoribosyl-AMP cyclohydrolase/phosphoribosyl-ATP diphosphatase HisIE [Ignavibacteriaceae bacterium]|nr:bifunctional phosphoribosyl-AMP cyclohydrolase/phosphoribosyl-ATP diphosphatase HisIE [Ignavibacteriaceae bacterium]